MAEIMWILQHPRFGEDVDMNPRQVHVLPSGWVRVFWSDDDVTLHSPASVHSIRGEESGPSKDVWVMEP